VAWEDGAWKEVAWEDVEMEDVVMEDVAWEYDALEDVATKVEGFSYLPSIFSSPKRSTSGGTFPSKTASNLFLLASISSNPALIWISLA